MKAIKRYNYCDFQSITGNIKNKITTHQGAFLLNIRSSDVLLFELF